MQENNLLFRVRNFFRTPKGFFIIFLGLFVANSTWDILNISQSFFLFISAFLLSLIFTPSMVEVSKILGIVDKPGEGRKIHKQDIALLGGVAVVLSFAGAILLSENSYPQKYKVLMIAGSLLAVVGLLDDVFKLSAKVRLLFQFFFALWVVDSGISLRLFPTQTLWGEKANQALSLIWIVGFTNAYNFIDGLDGLAAGLGIIIAFFCSFISLVNGVSDPVLIASPFIGALAGFLLYNFHPAWIFLGDVGAQFCGFVLAAIAADVAWANPGEYYKAILGPALVMWVLLFDMIQITIFRVKYGLVKDLSDWISFTGKDHIHHRLLFLLGSQRKSVFVIYIISALMSFVFIFLILLRVSYLIYIGGIVIVLSFSFWFAMFLDRRTSKDAFASFKI